MNDKSCNYNKTHLDLSILLMYITGNAIHTVPSIPGNS